MNLRNSFWTKLLTKQMNFKRAVSIPGLLTLKSQGPATIKRGRVVPWHAQLDFSHWARSALGEQESEWHTMGFSALTVFTWRHSSRFEVVLLNSFCSPKAPWVGRPGDRDCEWLPESLGGGGRGCMSPRCFLVTWASGPCTVFTCFRRELGSV